MPIGVTEAAAAASVLSSIRAILKELRQSSLSDSNRALVSQMTELVSDAQDRLMQLQLKNFELQQENQTLQQRLQAADELNARRAQYKLVRTAVGGMIYEYGGDAEPKHYACPRCLETDREIHALQPGSDYSGQYGCPKCGKYYDVKAPRDLPQSQNSWDPYEPI